MTTRPRPAAARPAGSLLALLLVLLVAGCAGPQPVRPMGGDDSPRRAAFVPTVTEAATVTGSASPVEEGGDPPATGGSRATGGSPAAGGSRATGGSRAAGDSRAAGGEPARALRAMAWPTFRPAAGSQQKEWSAGSAFLLRHDGGRTMLVTAFHLFGPSGGVPVQMTMPEVLRVVRQVEARPWLDGTPLTGGPALDIASARSDPSTGDLSHDVAAFPVTAPGRATLGLAGRAPRVGDRVFVPWNRDQSGGRLLAGTIVLMSRKQLVYVLDDPTPVMNGASGAPILDPSGDVVGMNLGRGQDDNGRTIEAGLTVDDLRAAIAEGLRRS